MSIAYYIYGNSNSGPINYTTPIANTNSLTWTSNTVANGFTYAFGVRAYDTVSGLIEQNLDSSVFVTINSAGQDVTSVPLAPIGTTAIPVANGAIRVNWNYPQVNPKNLTGFKVYFSPNYNTSVATIAALNQIKGLYTTVLTGLTNGNTYSIVVRSYNSYGSEQNTNIVPCVSDNSGPSPVTGLTLTLTSQDSY